MTKLLKRLVFATILLIPLHVSAQESTKQATVYKDPNCGCCQGYVDHLRADGFQVETVETSDLMSIKQEHGIPEDMAACHTMLIDGYVVEGHVPLTTLKKLLGERPAIKGIALPGMPVGTPGMEGPKEEPFTIYEISEGEPRVFNVE
jgi:hypothetical protein